MDSLSALSADYQARADFAEALNRAVRELRRAAAGEPPSDEAMTSVRSFLRAVTGVLAAVRLVAPADLRPSYELTSVVPWVVIRRVQSDNEGLGEELANVYQTLKLDRPLETESFEALDRIVEIAGSEANETFNLIAPS